MTLTDYIRDIQDFPKPGINFKDITPLLNDPEARKECLQLLVKSLGDQKIDKVVGVESRGFFFGMLLAQELNVGFVPVRKPKKLPFSVLSASYELEYGSDTLEIHTDAIQKGEKILIHDDVLATGGTAKAVAELVEKLGGEIVQFNFLMELSFLKGRNKISQYETYSPLVY
ncbi:adenine phosphoribosyltransferase [Flavobacterium soli]|uniref:adenine phosphoribosyltransferase n=1 Tax=Flavobacterium soli TaxID=344881 RepID=UPI00047AE71E|nr:adenine phosphoribosyltransferase [Flavobacterium soli]